MSIPSFYLITYITQQEILMKFKRMDIEKESPEEYGYSLIKNNLTESSISDQTINTLNLDIDLQNLVLSYINHSGEPELREIIAKNYANVSADNILVTNGAVMALFLVNVTLLSPGDKTVVIHPNYSTNVEVPRSLATDAIFYKLDFESNYRIDFPEFEKLITPDVKVISITYPHNPTGTMISRGTLKKLVSLAEDRDCFLLVDETYRELTMGEKLPTAASLGDRVISVESVSKSFGVPGVRIGWIATQNPTLKEKFLSTKEQISICNSVVDEKIALEILKRKADYLPNILADNRAKFQIVKSWIENNDYLEWVEPQGGVVCFPRFRPSITLNTTKFYDILNNKFGTFVGPGHWFEQSDRHFRIGYAWPEIENLKNGLECITTAIKESIQE